MRAPLHRILTGCAAAVLAGGLTMTLSACESTVAGTALRAQNAGTLPYGRSDLKESDLDRVLASVSAVNAVMNATTIRVSAETDSMNDSSYSVSDRDCLGAVYGGEELVYNGSGWTAVRDQVLQEPGVDNAHWVQQVAVLYPSAKTAEKFIQDAKIIWQQCEYLSVDIDSGSSVSTWDIDSAHLGDAILTQPVTQRDTPDWGCQHALTSVSNVVIEAWACGHGITDQGRALAAEMVENAGK